MGNLRNKSLLILLLAAVLIFFINYGQLKQTGDVEVVASSSLNNSSDNEIITVYVSGMVNNPGVIKLPPKSRVIDAINGAGGLAPGADIDKINLSQVLKDGMHIKVTGTAAPAAGTGVSTSTGKISINNSDKAELDKLPGIGPALAERIIQYRQTNGMFKDIEELKKVKGISDSKYNAIKDKITL